MTLLRTAARALLLLLAAILVVATVLPLSRSDAWWVRYPLYPALQLAAALPLAFLLLLPFRRRIGTRLALLALAAAFALQAGRLYPYLLPVSPAVPAAAACAPADRVRIVEVNVQRTNRHDDRLLDMIRALDPDIAWFQEINGWWEHELSPLADTMPHSLADAQSNYFGVHLFSRFPLSGASIQQLTGSNDPSAFATATLPSGRPLRLYAIHPRPPQVGQSTAERDAQLLATALAARGDTDAHLVVGDLNTVPWAGILDRVERTARVADLRIGRGLFITWNAERTLPKWPLDHVLTGPGIALVGLRVLPRFGSDHRPLLADLCVTGGAPPADPLPPDLLDAARATIARGQGKADQPGEQIPH